MTLPDTENSANFLLRLPEAMRRDLANSMVETGNTMTSEILERLGRTFTWDHPAHFSESFMKAVRASPNTEDSKKNAISRAFYRMKKKEKKAMEEFTQEVNSILALPNFLDN